MQKVILLGAFSLLVLGTVLATNFGHLPNVVMMMVNGKLVESPVVSTGEGCESAGYDKLPIRPYLAK